jgi:hypothetical protein
MINKIELNCRLSDGFFELLLQRHVHAEFMAKKLPSSTGDEGSPCIKASPSTVD